MVLYDGTLLRGVIYCGIILIYYHSIPRTSYYRFINKSLCTLNIETLKEAQQLFKKRKLPKEKIDQAFSKIGFQPLGVPTLISIDEEDLVVACSKMKALAS